MADFKHVHCVGIGGIGVSALAKLLHVRGLTVTGSEKHVFEVVDDVRALGIPVTVGFAAENIPEHVEVVIYSDAFRENNVEVETARARGIKTLSYPEALGVLSLGSNLFAVTGTNGKSTTTAMLGKILEAAAMDPTVVVGTKVPGFQYGNVRVGTREHWVVEADDYREHFLALSPQHAIVTNVELDHLDYFPDFAAVEQAFARFVKRVEPDGTLILNADNAGSFALKKLYPRARTFSLKGIADYAANNIHIEQGTDGPRTVFSVLEKGNTVGEIRLRLPGEMNVSNALAALAMAREQNIAFVIIKQALESFTGVWRRFQVVGTDPVVITDYAHHPTAIAPTIAAAHAFYPTQPIVAVFQPHQEERLRALLDEFAASFDAADSVVLAPIFKATGREASVDPITSDDLATAIQARDIERGIERTVLCFATEDAVIEYLLQHAEKQSCILMMSAGERYGIAHELHKKLQERFASV